MEYFDLVDENDTVIGITTKERSHTNADIHRVAAVYVFNADGKLYVQEHLKSGNKYDHSVGGHVDRGESYDTAAVREAYEELGIKDSLTKISVFFSDERFLGADIRHFFGLYECTPSNQWKFQPNEEVKNIIPMEIKDIVDLMNKEPKRFTAGFINTMREYITQKQLPYSLSINLHHAPYENS